MQRRKNKREKDGEKNDLNNTTRFIIQNTKTVNNIQPIRIIVTNITE